MCLSCKVLLLTPTLFENWIQLNTDDVVTKISHIATIEGVIRDMNGGWILGFNQFLRTCTILNIELWGILQGLEIAFDRGFDSNMIILSDSPKAIQIM